MCAKRKVAPKKKAAKKKAAPKKKAEKDKAKKQKAKQAQAPTIRAALSEEFAASLPDGFWAAIGAVAAATRDVLLFHASPQRLCSPDDREALAALVGALEAKHGVALSKPDWLERVPGPSGMVSHSAVFSWAKELAGAAAKGREQEEAREREQRSRQMRARFLGVLDREAPADLPPPALERVKADVAALRKSIEDCKEIDERRRRKLLKHVAEVEAALKSPDSRLARIIGPSLLLCALAGPCGEATKDITDSACRIVDTALEVNAAHEGFPQGSVPRVVFPGDGLSKAPPEGGVAERPEGIDVEAEKVPVTGSDGDGDGPEEGTEGS